MRQIQRLDFNIQLQINVTHLLIWLSEASSERRFLNGRSPSCDKLTNSLRPTSNRKILDGISSTDIRRGCGMLKNVK